MADHLDNQNAFAREVVFLVPSSQAFLAELDDFDVLMQRVGVVREYMHTPALVRRVAASDAAAAAYTQALAALDEALPLVGRAFSDGLTVRTNLIEATAAFHTATLEWIDPFLVEVEARAALLMEVREDAADLAATVETIAQVPPRPPRAPPPPRTSRARCVCVCVC